MYPTSLEKLDELIGLLRLRPGARVIEIASGKSEFMVRLAERDGISGIGVDISFIPFISKSRIR
ncbi:MAG: SAM-dependent methyltransferase, partial [Chloroflexota bacterium]